MRVDTATSLYLLGLASLGVDAFQTHKPQSMVRPDFWEPVEAINHEICSRAVDRLRLSNPDFNDLITQANSSGQPYTDQTFMFPQAIQWQDMRPVNADNDETERTNLFWTRISDYFNTEKYSLWGDRNVNYEDPEQGYLGDCWIIAAASSVSQNPERIKKIFLTEGLNSAGVYAVQLFTMGIPVTVTVDDHILTYTQNSNDPVYAGAASDGAMWMPILEKAAAKLFGNFEMISGGWMGPAIQTLTGAPFYEYKHGSTQADELWNHLSERVAAGWMVTAGTPTGPGTDQEQNALGMAFMHAYTVLKTVTLSDGTRLVRMRNPWGKETYHGPWADDSDRWTDAYKQEAGWVDEDDGAWFTTFENFHTYFSETHMNANIDNEHLTYWAQFETPKNVDNVLTITSPVAQTLYVSAYTYDIQHLRNGECVAWDNDTTLSVKSNSQDKTINFNDGYAHFDPIEIAAGGSLTYNIDLDWSDNELRAQDYSFVVWSTEQQVEITSSDNTQSSATFPNYDMRDSTELLDFNGVRIVSSDQGNFYEEVRPGEVVIPEGPPEPIIREAVSTEAFSDYYTLEGGHREIVTSVNALSADTFGMSVSIYDNGVTYNVQGYFELNKDTINAQMICGGTTHEWSKDRVGAEISGWKDCPQSSGQSPYQVQFKTNNQLPKWEWYNFADWMIEITVNSANPIAYTVGIEEADSSWKSKTSSYGSIIYEYEWIYSNSQFVNNSSDDQTLAQTIASSTGGSSSGDSTDTGGSSSDDSTDTGGSSQDDSTDTGGSSSDDSSETGGSTVTESFLTEERTDASPYSRDYGVVVNGAVVLDVVVDVKDHWTVEHGFSYMDLEAGVRDSLFVETEVQTVGYDTQYVQKILWNGVLQDTLNWDYSSPDINIDYVSPDGKYTYNHQVWPEDLWWDATMTKNNDSTGYPTLTHSFSLWDGWSWCTFTSGYDNWVNEYTLSQSTQFDPQTERDPQRKRVNENAGAHVRLLTDFDETSETGSSTYATVGASALILTMAGACIYMGRKKEDDRVDDEFNRV